MCLILTLKVKGHSAPPVHHVTLILRAHTRIHACRNTLLKLSLSHTVGHTHTLPRLNTQKQGRLQNISGL